MPTFKGGVISDEALQQKIAQYRQANPQADAGDASIIKILEAGGGSGGGAVKGGPGSGPPAAPGPPTQPSTMASPGSVPGPVDPATVPAPASMQALGERGQAGAPMMIADQPAPGANPAPALR